MHARTRGINVVVAAAALIITSAVVLFMLWAQGVIGAAGMSQAQSAIHPLASLRISAEPITAGRAFDQFNISLAGIAFHLLWLCAVLAAGNLVVRRSQLSASLPERLVFGFACGVTIIGTLVLLLGHWRLPSAWATWFLVIAATSAGAYVHRAEFSRAWSRASAASAPLAYPLRLISVLGLIVFLGAIYLYALTPPIQSDAVRYHLAAPQEYLKAGRIIYLPLNAFSNFPLLPEMHYMLALAAGVPEASQLMHVTAWFMCALAVVAFCKRVLPEGSRSYVLPMLLYLGTPAAAITAAWPFTDHFVALYFFAAFYAVIYAIREPSAAGWAIAGLMFGGALGSKYTAAVFLPMIAIVAIVEFMIGRTRVAQKGAEEWTNESPPPADEQAPDNEIAHSAVPLSDASPARLIFLGIVIAAITGGVWFMRNLINTGNPVYPLANSLFKGGEWSPANAQLYAAKAAEKGVAKNLTGFLRAPFDATFQWINFESQFLSGTLLILVVAAIAGVVIARVSSVRSRVPFYSAALALGFYGMWFFTYQSNRLLLPLLLFLAVPAALFFHASARRRYLHKIMVIFTLAAIVFSCGWTLQWVFAGSGPTSAYLTGAISGEQYLSNFLNYHRAFDHLNRNVKKGEKVLLIGEHRIYGARFHALWSDWFDTPAVLWFIRKHKIGDAKQLAEQLKKQGIVWILINSAELAPQMGRYFKPRFNPNEWQILQDFMTLPRAQARMIPPGVELFRLP